MGMRALCRFWANASLMMDTSAPVASRAAVLQYPVDWEAGY